MPPLVLPDCYAFQQASEKYSLSGFNFSFFAFSQVNQKGSEKPLEQMFAKMVNSMANGMVR